MNLKFAFLLSLLISTLLCSGQVWTGNVDAEWENGANWLSGSVPGNGEDIEIDSTSNYSGAKAHPIISALSSFIPKGVDILNGGKLRDYWKHGATYCCWKRFQHRQ